MIRSAIVVTAPVLAFSAAAWIVGPELIGLRRGEPMRVSAHESRPFPKPISFSPCPAHTIAPGTPAVADANAPAGAVRVVAVQLGSGKAPVAVTEIPAEAAPGATIVVVFDEAGKLVAAGEGPLAHASAVRPGEDCTGAVPSPAPTGAI